MIACTHTPKVTWHHIDERNSAKFLLLRDDQVIQVRAGGGSLIDFFQLKLHQNCRKNICETFYFSTVVILYVQLARISTVVYYNNNIISTTKGALKRIIGL